MTTLSSNANGLEWLYFNSGCSHLTLYFASDMDRMEKYRNSFKILTGTLAGKITLGRPRRRWDDNIRMNLKEIGINTRDWVDSA